MFDLPYPRYPDRLALLDEAAQVIRALWSGEPTSLDGEHLTLHEAMVHPRPASPSPTLVLGGKGARTLSVVARHATEWNCSYVGVEVFRDKSAELDRRCQELGRDPVTLGRSVMVPFVIGRDDAEVAAAIAGQRRTFAGLPAGLDAWIAAGFIWGTPERVVEQLGAFVEAGASRFMLQHNDLDDRASLELLATEVLPHVD
jgi:alkanesulfonate monooxygenase SsuD/methylene tetrahydromethanopterin reductase-like flavin-dependent oxidoreductase (luciferase family)